MLSVNGTRSSRRVRLLVVDDHDGFRSWVIRALADFSHLEVAGEAASGEGACAAVRTLNPDVVLMDLSMPGMDGFEATRRIRDARPGTRIVVLTEVDAPDVEQSALAAGASAVIPKVTPVEDLVGVILHEASAPELA